MKSDSIETFEIFPWNSNFETGIDEIDQQHKKLVDILNDLATHLASRSSDVELNEIFDELVSYTDYHFKTEETIWIEHFAGDEWYTKHEETHGTFIDELLLIKSNQSHKPLDDVVYEIVSFLSRWLAYHILDTDKRMAKAVLAIRKGASITESKVIADEEMGGSTKLLINTVLTMYDSLSSRTLDLMREKALRLQAEKALSQSEERWRFVLEGGVDNVWDWDITNNALKSSEDDVVLFEVVDKELKVNDHTDIYPADIQNIQKLEAHLRGESEFYSCRYRVMRKNGGWSWHLSRGKVVSRDEEGRPLRMIGTHMDITERELAEQIFTNSSQAIMISDVNNHIIAVNNAFTKITGYEAHEVIGKNPRILASGEHSKSFFRGIWHDIHHMGQWSGEIKNKRKNGEIYTELLMINTIKDTYGNIDHYFAIFDDITEKKEAEDIIRHQANYDMLTKLANRHMFQISLEQEIKRAKRLESSFALLFIDLDYFKNINDTFGHEMGDMLLIEAAKRIKMHVRESDIVARIGGDEFTIILTDISAALGLESIIQKILDDLNKPFTLDVNQVHISASIGVAVYPHDAKTAIDLLKNADQAMYLAKQSGRNSYRYFTGSMQVEAHKRRLVINDLHRALIPNQFEVFYQPIIDMKTGKITKAEALLRWRHPVQGYLLPNDFISFAEDSGIILEIGNWVYKEAMRQTKYWQQTFGKNIQISVNKSPAQLHLSSNMQEWTDYLEHIDLEGGLCIVEITEGLLMKYEAGVVKKLSELRNAGIQISLDDFGTGYSSMSYLQKFEIDFIKIDKSFISDLEHDHQDMALCEAMISMAHKLGIKVIAEGIETSRQKEILQMMRCDYGQGYLFSKPVPAEVFTELLMDDVRFK